MSNKFSYCRPGIWITFSLAADYIFFYALYPFAIWKAGLFAGGSLMACLSAVASYTALRLYDRSGKDLLGITAFKASAMVYRGDLKTRRLAAWALNKGGPVALVVLSAKFNPFVTTIYLRRGVYGFGGLRDWATFGASVLIGNAYCIGLMGIGWSAFDHMWFWR